jgi:hypothetical protein
MSATLGGIDVEPAERAWQVAALLKARHFSREEPPSMKRTLTILLAVLGLLAASCSSDGTETEASGGQLSSEAATDTGDVDADQDAADTDRSDDADSEGDDQVDEADPADDQADDGDETANGSGQTLGSAVLGRAIERTESLNSARFEGTINVVGLPESEMPGSLTMSFSGAFDNSAKASEMTLDMGEMFAAMAEADPEAAEGMGALFSSMFEEPMQVITIGEASWVKWGLLAMFGVEDMWLEGDASSGADLGADMGFAGLGGSDSPTAMLEELAGADAEVEEIGREDIRGVTTTHHRAVLDVAAMAQSMSPAERAEFEESLGAGPNGSFLLDLWTDDDDLLHRFQLSVSDLDPAEADGLQSMEFVYDLWDHGADVGISPPPADQIITEDELGFSLEDFAG